jgi:hypothetical protein
MIARGESMLTRTAGRAFAEEWVQAWNAHDLPRILGHYADDFEMTSPLIAALGRHASGTLKGKEAVGAYWRAALDKFPDLAFELRDVYCGVDSLAIRYRSILGKEAVELMFLDGNGKVRKAIAHYDLP